MLASSIGFKNFFVYRNQHGCQLYWILETNMVSALVTTWLSALLFKKTDMVFSFIVHGTQLGCQRYCSLKSIWLSALLFIETNMVVSFIAYIPTWLSALLFIETNMLVWIIA